MQHVGGVEGRAEGGDRADTLHFTRRADHRSATERMPDQQAGGEVLAAQVRGGGHDIGDVSAVVGIGEISVRPTQSGKVEAQGRDAFCGERA